MRGVGGCRDGMGGWEEGVGWEGEKKGRCEDEWDVGMKRIGSE